MTKIAEARGYDKLLQLCDEAEKSCSVDHHVHDDNNTLICSTMRARWKLQSAGFDTNWFGTAATEQGIATARTYALAWQALGDCFAVLKGYDMQGKTTGEVISAAREVLSRFRGEQP